MKVQDKYWDTIIGQYKKSGLSQLVFCKRNDIIYSQFIYRWNKKNQTTEAREAVLENSMDVRTFERMTITSGDNPPNLVNNVVELLIHLPNKIRCDVKVALGFNELPTLLHRLGGLC